MTLRDLTEEQVKEFQAAATRNRSERQKTRSDMIDIIDYNLFFSDGVKAVLARITELPK